MASKSVLQCGCKEVKNGTPSGAKSEPVEPTSNSSSIADPCVYDWQSGKCCVRQRLAHIFTNACFTDVVFIVGSAPHTQRIPAHKVLLSAGSRFFETMFSETWAPKSDEIPLPEDDPVAFAALVRFLYTDDIQLTADNVAAVLQAAKKYSITSLANKCVAFLSKNLCPENAFTTLSQAVLFQEQSLIDSCLEILDWFTFKAVKAEGFANIDLNTLCSVLKRDTLRIREIDLFQALLRWSEAECMSRQLEVNPQNQLSVSKEALRLIRFPLMSMKEFSSKEVAESGLLSDKEALSMMLYLARKDSSIPLFSRTPRLDPYLVVNRFPEIDENKVCSGKIEAIEFYTDRNMLLKGVGLYGSPEGAASFDVGFSLVNKKYREEFGENFRRCYYDGTTKTYRVFLSEPIRISARRVYQITVRITGPDSYCGTEGMNDFNVTLPDPNRYVTFKFFNVGSGFMHTSSSEGQIPELLFEL